MAHPHFTPGELASKAETFRARKAARAECRTAVVKCGLTRFCREPALRDLLQDAVSYFSKAAVEASLLATLHVLRTLEGPLSLLPLDHVFFDRCLAAVCNLHGPKHGQALTPELQVTLDRYLELRANHVGGLQRPTFYGHMKQTLSRETQDNFKTMISVTFKSRLAMWLRLQIVTRDSPYFSLYNNDVVKSAVSLMTRTCLTPEGSIRQLIGQYSRLTRHPVPDVDVEWMEEVCADVGENIGPLPLELKKRPEAYMPWLRRMLLDVSAYLARDGEGQRGIRSFSMLPQKHVRPLYVTLDNTILREFIRTGLGGPHKQAYDLLDHQSEAWRVYFNLRNVGVDGERRKVATVKTDGVAVSVTFDAPRATQLVERGLPGNEALSTHRLVSVDPGRVSIFTGVVYDPEAERTLTHRSHTLNEVVSCRGRRFHTMCGHRRRTAKMKRWTVRDSVVHAFNEEMPSAKTAAVDVYERVIVHILRSLNAVSAFYGSRRARKLRWHTHMAEQRGFDTLIAEITGGRPDTVVAYGDGSFSSSWAGTEPTPTTKFQKRLARNCRLHMVDEFRTSKLCCSCHGEMRGMPAGGSRLYGVRLCQDTACHRAKWNRDVNGAINIQNRFLEMVRGLPRAPPFCR